MKKVLSLYNKIIFIYRFCTVWSSRVKLLRLTVKYMLAVRIKKVGLRMQSDQTIHQINVKYNGVCFPIYMRLQDISMLYEVWLDQSYKTDNIKIDKGAIVDLGAHVGFTTLYFWALLGDGRNYIAIEGSSKNSKLLRMNTKAIHSCKIHESVITADGRKVKFYDEVSGHLHQVHITKGVEQQSVSLTSIIDQEKIEAIAIIKIDIEGMEHEILQHNNGWLSSTDQIFLELHQSIQNELLRSKMFNNGFDWKLSNGIIKLSRRDKNKT